MSFWAKVGVKVTDMDCFKASCRKHGIEFKDAREGDMYNNYRLRANLYDPATRGSARLVYDGGAFRIMMDTDAGYSAMTRKLGKNGGVLSRDYTREVIDKNISASGGYVTDCEELKDGSLLIKASNY